MTVTAPPRPPRPSDPVEREELEALVEALIEEARRRARRRRRIYGAVAVLVALLGVALFTVFERTAQSQSAPAALPHGRALPERRARRSPSFACPVVSNTEMYVMNADGSGQRRLMRIALLAILPGRPTGGRSPSSTAPTATPRSTS